MKLKRRFEEGPVTEVVVRVIGVADFVAGGVTRPRPGGSRWPFSASLNAPEAQRYSAPWSSSASEGLAMDFSTAFTVDSTISPQCPRGESGPDLRRLSGSDSGFARLRPLV